MRRRSGSCARRPMRWPRAVASAGAGASTRTSGGRAGRGRRSAAAELGAFCESEGIDAHFRRSGWLWTATSPAQLGAWEGAVAAAERAGEHPFAAVSAEEAQRRTGSPVHLGAVVEAEAATVHPALLARGLRRVAGERGIRVFERS